MHPTKPVAAVGRDHDLIAQPAAPLLGNQRMDLTGRVQPNERHVPHDGGRSALGLVHSRTHLRLGRVERQRIGVAALVMSFGPSARNRSRSTGSASAVAVRRGALTSEVASRSAVLPHRACAVSSSGKGRVPPPCRRSGQWQQARAGRLGRPRRQRPTKPAVRPWARDPVRCR